jgi:hypothetical protein
MFPATAYTTIGKDCSTFPGVAGIVVRHCLPGYVPALDGTSCICEHRISQSHFADAKDAPARVYGLEHISPREELSSEYSAFPRLPLPFTLFR